MDTSMSDSDHFAMSEPSSALSDYPDDLSNCSEARAENGAIQTLIPRVPNARVHKSPQPLTRPLGSSRRIAVKASLQHCPPELTKTKETYSRPQPPKRSASTKRNAERNGCTMRKVSKNKKPPKVDKFLSSRNNRIQELPAGSNQPTRASSVTSNTPRKPSLVVRLPHQNDLPTQEGEEHVVFSSEALEHKRGHKRKSKDSISEAAPRKRTRSSQSSAVDGTSASLDSRPLSNQTQQVDCGPSQIVVDKLRRAGLRKRVPKPGTHAVEAIPPKKLLPAKQPTDFHNSEDYKVPDSHDTELHALALELLAHRNTDAAQGEPNDCPEVWADNRTELCETLPYYRSYKSACYHTGGIVRGFMFAKCGNSRDYTDASVVISGAGGGRTKNKASGEMEMV